jgi:hypothetical protein
MSKSLIEESASILLAEKRMPTLFVDLEQFPNPLKKELSSYFLVKGLYDGEEGDDRVKSKDVMVSADSLNPSQSEIFMGKALGMAVNGIAGGNLDAVISSDNHILDGHHRWCATMFADPKLKVGGTMVDLTIGDLIPVMRAIGDALGNKRRGAPKKSNDINVYTADREDIEAAIYEGRYMDPKFYSREKSIEWIEGVGGIDNVFTRLKMIQSKRPPRGAPPRTDMPVIDADKGHVNLVSDLLKQGKIDVKTPYAPLEK